MCLVQKVSGAKGVWCNMPLVLKCVSCKRRLERKIFGIKRFGVKGVWCKGV